MPDDRFILVHAQEMQDVFENILTRNGLEPARAWQCAAIFTENSTDGVYTHGVNRFARFVSYLQKGWIRPAAGPVIKNKLGAIEQWDGQLGPGILNALFCTDQVVQLARQNGIGCVALSGTNHWMRGGTYGWRAAKAGCVFIGWTNTIANMPAWGATDPRLGNNPLVMALPHMDEAIVLDMAMSQFSFGALEFSMLKNKMLDVPGGFDKEGNLTTDPAQILTSRRLLPAGYWKGAGMALLLDILATILSGGLSTKEISSQQDEYGLSQVFIAIDLTRFPDYSLLSTVVAAILADYKQSAGTDNASIVYPGERVLQTRKTNLAAGIPVIKKVWEDILRLL